MATQREVEVSGRRGGRWVVEKTLANNEEAGARQEERM